MDVPGDGGVGERPFNIGFIAQAGRLQYEALLLAASLRACDPGFAGRLIALEPQPGGAWIEDPRISSDGVRQELARLEVEIVPFSATHFGTSYPHGNKIEALAAMPDGAPFLFLDSDTLVTGRLSQMTADFSRPAASMRREATWPKVNLYGPGIGDIWASLYAMFGLDLAPTLDERWPTDHWKRYLYFSAGWFLYRDPQTFGRRFLEIARAIRDTPPRELAGQVLDPWLDQIALPLVVHSLGGGRPGTDLAGLDGDVTCHWRTLPLLYARESDCVVDTLESVCAPNRIKKVLKEYEPFRRMVFQRRGHKVRALFDRKALPRNEQAIRHRIKAAGFWMR